MSEAFDPYHRWLGIVSGGERPDHYRLLGIAPLESDPDVIEAAADRQASHLRTFQTGKHSALSQRLLNEVSAAKICLLQPKSKAAYDAQLRQSLKRTSGLMSQKARIVVASASALVLIAVVSWLFRSPAKPEPKPDVAKREPELTGSPPPPATLAPKPPEDERPRPEPKPEPVAGVAQSLPSPPPLPASPPAAPLPSPRDSGGPTMEPGPSRSLVAAEPVRPAEPPTPPAATPSRAQSELPKPPALSQPPVPREQVTASAEKPASAPPERKRLLPDSVARERATVLARDTYKGELDKARTGPEKQALAGKLLEESAQFKGDSAGLLAVLQLAREVALEAGDGRLAFEAIDRMAEEFRINPFPMKLQILADFAKQARSTAIRKSIVERTLVVLDEALIAGEAAAAGELYKLAQSEAGKTRSKELVQQVRARRKELDDAAQGAEELKAAREALAATPKDPGACLVIGRHLCFSMGDWRGGLPLLAEGSDEALNALAKKELAAASGQSSATASPANSEFRIPTSELLALADGWWEVAQTRHAGQRDRILLHAGDWYLRAEAGLSGGLEQARVSRRLVEVSKLRLRLPPPPGAIAPFDEKRARQHQQAWSQYMGAPAELSNSIGMKLVIIPPGEFDMGSTPEQIQQAQADGKKNGVPAMYFKRVAAEGPRHHVKLTKALYLGAYPVTQAEYEKVMGKNPFGLYDMYGNVRQCCLDWYREDYYSRSPAADPIGESFGSAQRVLRGGGYTATPTYCRSACRDDYPTTSGFRSNGFRVACVREASR